MAVRKIEMNDRFWRMANAKPQEVVIVEITRTKRGQDDKEMNHYKAQKVSDFEAGKYSDMFYVSEMHLFRTKKALVKSLLEEA